MDERYYLCYMKQKIHIGTCRTVNKVQNSAVIKLGFIKVYQNLFLKLSLRKRLPFHVKNYLISYLPTNVIFMLRTLNTLSIYGINAQNNLFRVSKSDKKPLAI